MDPLQLSSTLLQVSVAGSVSPTHAPEKLPATQACAPSRHAPTPRVLVVPL
jgi:hypothetical protein